MLVQNQRKILVRYWYMLSSLLDQKYLLHLFLTCEHCMCFLAPPVCLQLKHFSCIVMYQVCLSIKDRHMALRKAVLTASMVCCQKANVTVTSKVLTP